MTSLIIFLIIIPLFTPLFKLVFLLVAVVLVVNKVSYFSYEQVRRKMILIVITLLIIGIPVFLFRNIIISIFELDYNTWEEFVIIFVSGTFFKEFFLDAGDVYIKSFASHSTNNENPNILMMESANPGSSSNIPSLGPEERHMNLNIQDNKIFNEKNKEVFLRDWGYAKSVPSSNINGQAHLFTGGNYNYDFSNQFSHKLIAENFAEFLEHESTFKPNQRIPIETFSVRQREFLVRILKHYHSNTYAGLLPPEGWPYSARRREFYPRYQGAKVFSNTRGLRDDLRNIPDPT